MRWLLERWRHLSPPTLLVASFALLILLASLGLLLLPGLYTGERLGVLDVLFTATSAVCVTGLTVVDTAKFFTFWGQLWLLLFIQLGGLGLITLTTLIIGALGRRLSLRSEVLAVPAIHHDTPVDVWSLTAAVARFTFTIEAAGAALLWLQWLGYLGAGGAVWPAVFHAVNGYCNAGFSIFTDSLSGFASAPGIVLTMSALIIIGGLGYLATGEVLRWYRAAGHRGPRRLSSHTFAVVGTTAVLLACGTVLFALFEWNGVLGELGVLDKLANAWFMSVTPRTAGFYTVPYEAVGNETAFLTVLLMVVGGSPGSTAGGIKTTAVAILVALALARIRGRRHVALHDRTLPDEAIQRTVSLVLLVFAILAAATFLLTIEQTHAVPLAQARQQALPLLFEAVSAFGTVGLSMGLTPALEPGGKLVVIALMFLGRVGPLAFFAAISIKSKAYPAELRAAREDVIVG